MFSYVEKFIKNQKKLGKAIDDVSVIFFTDGQAGDTLELRRKGGSFKRIKTFLSQENVSSRFLTLGFTSSHDAVLLNEMSKLGSDLGNFIYIDTNKP